MRPLLRPHPARERQGVVYREHPRLQQLLDVYSRQLHLFRLAWQIPGAAEEVKYGERQGHPQETEDSEGTCPQGSGKRGIGSAPHGRAQRGAGLPADAVHLEGTDQRLGSGQGQAAE